MIKSISIKNFKSVVNLKLDLGQFNILIGENGCGKSNILEGIAFGSAALSNKLEREYFANRGIRYSDPTSIYSAFNHNNDEYINISIEFKESIENLVMYFNAKEKPARWEIENNKSSRSFIDKDGVLKQFNYITYPTNNFLKDINQKIDKLISETETLRTIPTQNVDVERDRIFSEINQIKHEVKYSRILYNEILPSLNFLIFSLEESILRKFDAENAIHPLGRNGEGLFAYLKEISQKENGIKMLQEIKENLSILDWFDDLEIPKDQLSKEFSLRVKDKYIDDTLHFFDQRSTNEGFLYLLFYLTLFISDETPSFFAIDNLEASFNPKLCREITKRLIALAKKHNKQVVVTTHSPAILDGLDLTNEDERLFVIRRNMDGYTKANRIEYKPSMNIALSEAWTKGYIGGLPENF